MSYQLVCDNCGQIHTLVPLSNIITTSPPTNWERIYDKDPPQHLCPECVKVKDAARWDVQSKMQKAQEEALAARRVKA